MVLNVKTVFVGAAVIIGGYYGYRHFYGDIQNKSVAKLIRLHAESEPARQLIIKRRILSIYSPSRDYEVVARALDSPNPATQTLAIAVIRDRNERRATPTLVEMLDDERRTDVVMAELASAMADLNVTDAISRLIELTDKKEPQSVRAAAHSALKALTGAKGEMKLSGATREHWTLLWRDHRQRHAKDAKK